MALVSGVVFFTEGVLGYVVSPILLLLTKSVMILAILAFTCNFLSVASLSIFQVKESFQFYLARGRYVEAEHEIERVLRINNVHE